MFVYVDESEWPRPATPGGFTVWAAIALRQPHEKQLFREVFNLEKKFWKVVEPYDFEIKGRLLLSEKATTSPKKREFVEEILSLCKLNDVISFAIGLRYPQTPTLKGIAPPNTFQVISALCERVETMMEEQSEKEIAIIVFDSQGEGKDKVRALEYGNYVYGTPVGRDMVHVASTPLFASSGVTKGVQIADLFAYALAQQNMGRSSIKPVCDRIRELEWRSNAQLEGRPWRGFHFRDVVPAKEERIGGAPRST